MKKVIVIVVMLCILLLPLFFINNNSELLITTFKKSYSIVSKIDEKDKLEVLIYINNKNSSILDIDNIIKSSIHDDESHINLRIDSITDLDYTQVIKNNKFYLYSFIFDIEFESKNEFSLFMKKVMLALDLNETSYNLEIGSFSYNKVMHYGDSDNTISVAQITPLIDKIDVNDSILGIGLKLKNFSNRNIIVNSIDLLDYNVIPSLNEIKEVDINTINNKNISEILGYSYNFEYQDTLLDNKVLIYIENKNEYEFLLPIKYLNRYPVNSFGLKIEYCYEEDTDKIHTYYFDDYVYFNSNYITYKSSDIIINKYENS